VNDGIDSHKRFPKRFLVADIASDFLEGGVAAREDVVPEKIKIEDANAVSAGEKFGNEHRSHVAGTPRDENGSFGPHRA
jgi:hypothetical protein